MTGRKLFAGVALMALAGATCGGTDTTATIDGPTTTEAVVVTTTVPPTTTTTVPPTTTTTLSQEELEAIQYEEDVKAITTLWRRFSDSWFSAVESGFAYMAEHNYPAMECTAEDFAFVYGETEEGYQEEVVVDQTTIERDDGWVIPAEVAVGTIPDGRIYIMKTTWTFSAPGFTPTDEVIEVHTTLLADGTAHFFIGCGKEE